MFRLTRVYSITSLAGIVVIAIALGVFYRTIAVRALVEHETLANISLTQALSNALLPKYADFVNRARDLPPTELATQPELVSLREEVLQKIRGLRGHPLVADIERTEYTVLGGVTVLLLLLYLFLLVIVRRADRIIRHHEDEERKAQAEQIHYMAYRDSLTGLPNCALFKDRLQHAVSLVARHRYAGLSLQRGGAGGALRGADGQARRAQTRGS